MELVQEIHQLLMDREDTCHRTCFSLQLEGNPLDHYAELKNVTGLKEGSVIKVNNENGINSKLENVRKPKNVRSSKDTCILIGCIYYWSIWQLRTFFDFLSSLFFNFMIASLSQSQDGIICRRRHPNVFLG